MLSILAGMKVTAFLTRADSWISSAGAERSRYFGWRVAHGTRGFGQNFRRFFNNWLRFFRPARWLGQWKIRRRLGRGGTSGGWACFHPSREHGRYILNR